MQVQIAYALPERQSLITIEVALGTTVHQAISISGILTLHPEIDLACNEVGVYGKIVSLETELCNDDRVEIYRALLIDPKVIRHKRVIKKRSFQR